MDYRKIALGIGAFVGGAAALTGLAAALGRYRPEDAPAGGAGQGSSAPSGDLTPSVTANAAAPAAVPATEINQPEGQAERERGAQPAFNPAAEHVPTDLMADAPVTIHTRAPEAFRPDPTAVPTPEEREALRPATGPAPSLVADEGSGFSEAAGAA